MVHWLRIMKEETRTLKGNAAGPLVNTQNLSHRDDKIFKPYLIIDTKPGFSSPSIPLLGALLMKLKPWILAIFVLLSLCLSPHPTAPTPQAGPAQPLSGNPAAIYCRDVMGYPYEIITDEAGGQTGLCQMPDGAVCDQWDFYAGTCGGRASYCAREGLDLIPMSDGQDPFAPRYALCQDPRTRETKRISTVVEAASPCGRQESAPAWIPISPTLQGPDEAPTGATRAPASFDWRSVNGANWLTSVKNQASCGSCWAFATLGTVEASWEILTGNPNLGYNLSEEYLVSTCTNVGTCGDCFGGSSNCAHGKALTYGMITETCMPYTATNSTCSGRCSNWEDTLIYAQNRVSGFYSLTQTSLKEYISRNGPVTVYMGIGGDYGGYFDGSQVYRCSSDSGINHAVIAAGYNDAGGYWIIKNSWGTSFGDSGYFKVGYGECMIDFYHYSFVDTLAPESAHALSGTMGENGWYTSSITINLTGTDAYGTGMDYLEHRTNGGGWTRIYGSSAVVNITTDGTHTLDYRGADHGGNIENNHTITLKKDAAPPANPAVVTETVCGAASGVPAPGCTDPAFSWLPGTDAASGAAGYEVYFGENAAGTSPAAFTTGLTHDPGTITGGTYYLRMRTKDQAGNWSHWETRFILTTDADPPASSHVLSGVMGENGWYTSDITLSITAADAGGSGIDYIEHRLNTEAWTRVFNSTAEAVIDTDGEHTFDYRAADRAGNLEDPHTLSLKRDAAPPQNPTLVTETACGTISGVPTRTCTDPAFSWNSATDSPSGVAGYGVYFGPLPDGTDSSAWTTAVSHDPGMISEGTWYLRLRTKDQAGNWSAWETRFNLIYDTLNPATSHGLSGDPGENGWYTSDVEIHLSASDSGGSGVNYIEYVLEPFSWYAVFASSTTATVFTDGEHTFHYRAMDLAGNLESAHTLTFKRDAAPPLNPGWVTETSCGAASGVPIAECTNPVFTWPSGFDATSGVAAYAVYFGTDPQGTQPAVETTDLSFDGVALQKGTYYFRLRTKDQAGNWSAWETRFTLENAHRIYLPAVLK
jgi:C1A family cysteine protease/putative hemolysin